MSRSRPPECFHCGYDLTGFGVGQTCPECGRAIRVLYENPPRAKAANAAVILGSVSLVLMLTLCCGAWPVLFVFPVLSWIGLVCAVVCGSQLRRDGARFSRDSRRVGRVGFWLCVPGVVLSVVVLAGVLYEAVT